MNPEPLTTTQSVDFVYFVIFGISAAMLVGITATMIYFVVRYHRSRQPKPTSQVRYNIPLEVAWTVIPTIIVLGMFWYGWQGYLALTDVPDNALPVKVTGRMWSWSFEYENGRTSDKLVIPVERAVRVDITSEDVLHSFFIPAFRVKKDAVPGMTTHLWFRAPREGTYDIFCAEYCGVGHSGMISTVEALPQHEFEEWYRGETRQKEATEGRDLLEKYGCSGCHSLDGSKKVGPTFQGLFGRQVTVVTDGRERTLTVDEEYLKRSILHPHADVVKGFPPAMPSFEGRIPEHDLEEIIEFFRREAGGKNTEMDGEKLMREKGCLGCHSTDGSRKVGPSFKGIFGSRVTVEKDGEEKSIEVDEEYIRRSITHPGEEIVKGFPAAMPPFPDLSEEELEALVDYIRGLR